MIADCRFFGEVGEWKGLKEIVGMRRGLGTGRVRNLPAMSRFTDELSVCIRLCIEVREFT
jgi:hypothetical protein